MTAAGDNRAMITVSVMLATIMQALDMTIANVALPHMQGTMSATQDQISWVLTSYIVAAAIFMPLTGFLSARLGRKRVFLWAVAGFTVASMLCGAAQNLSQMVLFRLAQGIFGAALVPLSQAVLLDTFPRERHGAAMAMWGVGVMLGPILGPTLGGVLTEYYNWRWVFYINLPIGLLAWLGLMGHVRETPIDRDRHFDVFGFAMLSLALGSMQLLLDRGESVDWFNSGEAVIEAGVACLAAYLFLAHTLTYRRRAFVDPAMFRDRNFTLGLVFMFVVGIILLATVALLPPYMQLLMGYPVVDVGFLLAPRGIGTMLAMVIAGRLASKVDVRVPIIVGIGFIVFSLWDMTQFNLDARPVDFIRTGVLQGIGLGLVFVTLSAVTFSTLPARFRDDGTGLFSLSRNIGSSIGVSAVTTYLAQQAQANHARLAEHIHAANAALPGFFSALGLGIDSPLGLAMLNGEVSRQAAALAYLQDFRLLMYVTLAALPLAIFLRAPRHAAAVAAVLD